MTDGVTSLMFGLGIGTWAYAKYMRRTYSTRSGVIGAGFVGVLAFVVLFTFLKYVIHF